MKEQFRQVCIGSKQLALNERQATIFQLIVEGKRNKEIAHLLNLSERTVKWYITQLFLIFGASNRTELAGLARHQEVRSP